MEGGKPLMQALKERHTSREFDAKKLPIQVVSDLNQANMVLTSKKYFRDRTKKVKDAEAAGIPIYVLRSNTIQQMRQFLSSRSALRVKSSGSPGPAPTK